VKRRDLARKLVGLTVLVHPACHSAAMLSEVPRDAEGSITLNHGHRAVITAAQLAAGGGLTMDIRGDSTHSHFLTLTADEVRRIGAAERVSQHSSDGFDDKHDHVVTFN
jgi:hypothetical protein